MDLQVDFAPGPQGLGFRGLGFRVSGLGFRGWGSWNKVGGCILAKFRAVKIPGPRVFAAQGP